MIFFVLSKIIPYRHQDFTANIFSLIHTSILVESATILFVSPISKFNKVFTFGGIEIVFELRALTVFQFDALPQQIVPLPRCGCQFVFVLLTYILCLEVSAHSIAFCDLTLDVGILIKQQIVKQMVDATE